MHAAQTNSSEPGLPEPSVRGWPSTRLVALPPAEALPPGSMALARILTQQQQETFVQVAELLAQLAHLAEQARCHETSAREREELNRSFHQLASSLRNFTEASLHGQPIFSRQDWTVELDPPGNKLVIPGIHRSPERLGCLAQTDLLSNRSATETYQLIVEVREWVAIDQALITEIRSRLSFVIISSRPSSAKQR